jgi:hypothetical protein
VATELAGFTSATFTKGPQMSYRQAIAAKAGTTVDKVILSNIRAATRRRLSAQSLRLTAAAAAAAAEPCACTKMYRPVTCGNGKTFGNACEAKCENALDCVDIAVTAAAAFDTSISVAGAEAAKAMVHTVAAIAPAAIKDTFVTKLKAAKASGAYPDMASVNVVELAAAITVTKQAPQQATVTGAPTPAPSSSTGAPTPAPSSSTSAPTPAPSSSGSGGGSKVGAEVAVPLVALVLGGAWLVRKKGREESSARKSGHAQNNFLAAPDQDLDAHYSAM